MLWPAGVPALETLGLGQPRLLLELSGSSPLGVPHTPSPLLQSPGLAQVGDPSACLSFPS